MNSAPLHILYVGPMPRGSTCLQRMNVLRELGHRVTPLDVDPITRCRSRIFDVLQFRTSWSPKIVALNRHFVSMARQVRPDVIWVDKGIYLRPESIQQVRGIGRLVHFNPDDPFGLAPQHGWRLFRRSIPFYDLHFVARQVNVQEYQEAGAARVLRFHWSFDRALHHPVQVSSEIREQLGGPIGFIGLWEKERESSIRHLAERGQDVRVWGPCWEHAAPHPQLKIEHRAIWDAPYTQAVCAFDINLGFLRKRNRDLSTQRSIEIPACGAFMLAERTDEHLALFDEGREAEFFDGPDELLEKVKYYLAHEDQRRAIAAAGRQRCLRDGYSNHDRLAWMIQRVREL